MLSLRLISKRQQWMSLVRFTSTTPEIKSIQPPNPHKINQDMIGPPDPVSNLRKIIFRQPENETKLEKRHRELRTEVQKWNHDFWTNHNSRFFQEREDYIKNNLPAGQQNLSADEMSVFYKAFLDRNWKNHTSYNMEWYKKNITLIVLSIKVKLARMLKITNTK